MHHLSSQHKMIDALKQTPFPHPIFKHSRAKKHPYHATFPPAGINNIAPTSRLHTHTHLSSLITPLESIHPPFDPPPPSLNHSRVQARTHKKRTSSSRSSLSHTRVVAFSLSPDTSLFLSLSATSDLLHSGRKVKNKNSATYPASENDLHLYLGARTADSPGGKSRVR